jgi:hypothetical protein
MDSRYFLHDLSGKNIASDAISTWRSGCMDEKKAAQGGLC